MIDVFGLCIQSLYAIVCVCVGGGYVPDLARASPPPYPLPPPLQLSESANQEASHTISIGSTPHPTCGYCISCVCVGGIYWLQSNQEPAKLWCIKFGELSLIGDLILNIIDQTHTYCTCKNTEVSLKI